MNELKLRPYVSAAAPEVPLLRLLDGSLRSAKQKPHQSLTISASSTPDPLKSEEWVAKVSEMLESFVLDMYRLGVSVQTNVPAPVVDQRDLIVHLFPEARRVDSGEWAWYVSALSGISSTERALGHWAMQGLPTQSNLLNQLDQSFESELSCEEQDEAPPDRGSLEAAKKFISSNPRYKALPQPFIDFINRQTVLTWHSNGARLMLFFSKDTVHGFIKEAGAQRNSRFAGEAETADSISHFFR